MLPVNDLRKGDAIILDGETYLVMDAHFHRAQQRKANVRTKLKNMIKGNIIEKTFSSTESVEEADISYRKAQYLYEEGNSYIFMILDNYEQVHVDAEVLGDNKYYLLDNSEVDLQYINDEVTAVRFPIHVILGIAYTEPGFKGDTTGSTLKPAKLETGMEVNVPLFINIGDKIKVDTRDDSYVERVNK